LGQATFSPALRWGHSRTDWQAGQAKRIMDASEVAEHGAGAVAKPAPQHGLGYHSADSANRPWAWAGIPAAPTGAWPEREVTLNTSLIVINPKSTLEMSCSEEGAPSVK
jgi:hypothetical protein